MSKPKDVVLEALEPLRERREELVAEATRLKDEARAVDAQVARIDKVLRAAQPTVAAKPRVPARPVTEATKGWAIKVLELMQSQPDKTDWRMGELVDAIGVGQSTLSPAVSLLREQGRVRPTRGVQGGGHAYGLYK